MDTEPDVKLPEKLQNLVKGEAGHVDNGEDDTVMVTPEVLAAMQGDNVEGNETSQDHSEQKHEPHPDDKGDTVFVASERMKAFREKLNKLDD